MKISRSLGGAMTVLCFAGGTLLPASATAQSAADWEAGKWQSTATIYAYLPTIGGSLAVPAQTGGAEHQCRRRHAPQQPQDDVHGDVGRA